MTDESKELATQLPTNQAIVRRYQDNVARSAKDIRPGEVVFIDRHGAPLGRARYVRLLAAVKVGILGALIGGPLLAVTGHWLPGGLLYLAGMSPVWWSKYRGGSALLAIQALARQGNLDEAQRRFDDVQQLRRRNPGLYCWLAGSLASHRGDHARALTWWRESLPRFSGVHRELVKLKIVNALLLSGRVEEARREYESVKLPSTADEVVTGQNITRTMFVLCDPSASSPSEDDLHAWARQALEYSHTGADLAALGWAFERRGDGDMAHFLAAEAVKRMHYPYLATWWPALQQWLYTHAGAPDATEAP